MHVRRSKAGRPQLIAAWRAVATSIGGHHVRRQHHWVRHHRHELLWQWRWLELMERLQRWQLRCERRLCVGCRLGRVGCRVSCGLRLGCRVSRGLRLGCRVSCRLCVGCRVSCWLWVGCRVSCRLRVKRH